MVNRNYLLHLDGDSFFVSVELVRLPHLRGRPVVTGSERSIATALSPEAKALGVVRGMPVFQIRERFPEVVILPSHYESYAQYSKRMIDIVRRFTPLVEPYSIDECFAEISVASDKEALSISRIIQNTIEKELSITVSIGLAETKVLAKIASKWNKPKGITLIPKGKEESFLQKTPISKVWGIGRVSSVEISRLGIKTAWDFALKPRWWVEDFLAKPQMEIWNELRGVRVKPLDIQPDDSQKSISRTQSFGFSTSDRAFLYSELSRHVEDACRQARALKVKAKGFTFFLKTRGFRIDSREVKLFLPSASPTEILKEISHRFHNLYNPNERYRTTGVTLWGMVPSEKLQPDLFGATHIQDNREKVFRVIDQVQREVRGRFRGQVISLASSLRSEQRHGRGDRAFVEYQFAIPFLGDAC